MADRRYTSVRVAAFLAVLLALHLAFRHAYFFQLSDMAPMLAKEREFIHDASPCDVLFMGNSHMVVGIDHKMLPSAEKIASLQEPYAATYYKLKRVLESRALKPKVVVVQLDLHSFADYREETLTNLAWAPYVNYWDFARERKRYGDVFQNWVTYCAVPYAGRAPEVIDRVTGRGEPAELRLKRYMEMHFGPARSPEESARRAANYHLANRNWRDDEAVGYLHRILDLCRRNDIRFVWVQVPVTREYFDAAVQLLPIEAWERLVREITNEYPEIILMDYRSSMFDHREYFADSDHLNQKGREWLTSRLIDDLREWNIISPEEAGNTSGSTQ